MIIFKLRKKIA